MGEGGVTYFDSNSCFGNWHKLIIPLVNGLLTKNQFTPTETNTILGNVGLGE